MTKKKATIIDLEIGNIFSLKSALNFCGIETIVSSKISEIEKAENIILPGDGSFAYSMKKIKDKNLYSFLKNIKNTRKNLLGICVGMQLLFEKSSEHGETEGLNIFKGEIKPIPPYDSDNNKIDIPNINWCPIFIENEDKKKTSILKGIDNSSNMYFIHSYRVENYNKTDEISSTEYFGNKILAIVGNSNIVGFQFHPEKSGEIGLKLLKNYFKIN
jgi:imidazole glycerol-phosphate synthase subunit HisH